MVTQNDENDKQGQRDNGKSNTDKHAYDLERDIRTGSFGDLQRRLEHYSWTVRRTPLEFHRNIILIFAGGIVATVTIALSYHARYFELIASSTTDKAVAQRAKLVLAAISSDARDIFVILMMGMLAAVFSALIMYFRARMRVHDVRALIDNALFGNNQICAWEPPFPKILGPVHTALAIVASAMLVLALIKSVGVVFTIISLQ